ncbi:MAG: hypothetical protein HYX47_15240 [Burkholderiales bacterium]|nr:hypothetical protein [Burkholderiales bacterium]
MAFADSSEYELEDLVDETPQKNRRSYNAGAEDRHWAQAHWKEPYFRADYDYEDYAPAYCVGYSGCAQYGGPFDEAETSLCANWLRIKGDSRLSWDEARPAVRAAWLRIEMAVLPLLSFQ